MVGENRHRLRYALVGAGARAERYLRAIATEYGDTAELVALADSNSTRMRVHNRWLAEHGAAPVPAYHPADFRLMLDKEQVDVVLVTTVDATHDEYIVAALDAGRDAITEKPMTVDATRCRRILDAVARTGRRVTVTFNYRYNPLHERVRELLAAGEIGDVTSVHFEWLLDVRHGADYFRRWHRDKANSGGLLVHKSCHHFDLVNWWLAARPVQAYALGQRCFYGPEGAARHDHARRYERAHEAPDAADDPFALRLADHPRLAELYLAAEHEDGYLRDRNVFAPGVSIEDDLAVLVRYSSGATMTYHLTAYAPWEGYRVAFNGTRGRLQLDVVENSYVSLAGAGRVKGQELPGEAAAETGSVRLTVHPFWEPPREEPVTMTRGGHGGADARMTAALFDPDSAPDPLGRSATAVDGAVALLTGLAANRSLETGQPVQTSDVLAIP